jgi:hypothetical protein
MKVVFPMRQDFFEFTPQFKLLIAGNHKPGLRSVDEAIRRRLYLIPFIVKIPAEERDPELLEKLKWERPGILCWMIEGCLLAAGLMPKPKRIDGRRVWDIFALDFAFDRLPDESSGSDRSWDDVDAT